MLGAAPSVTIRLGEQSCPYREGSWSLLVSVVVLGSEPVVSELPSVLLIGIFCCFFNPLINTVIESLLRLNTSM